MGRVFVHLLLLIMSHLLMRIIFYYIHRFSHKTSLQYHKFHVTELRNSQVCQPHLTDHVVSSFLNKTTIQVWQEIRNIFYLLAKQKLKLSLTATVSQRMAPDPTVGHETKWVTKQQLACWFYNVYFIKPLQCHTSLHQLMLSVLHLSSVLRWLYSWSAVFFVIIS
jgi:hypothetical protein